MQQRWTGQVMCLRCHVLWIGICEVAGKSPDTVSVALLLSSSPLSSPIPLPHSLLHILSQRLVRRRMWHNPTFVQSWVSDAIEENAEKAIKVDSPGRQSISRLQVCLNFQWTWRFFILLFRWIFYPSFFPAVILQCGGTVIHSVKKV